AQLRGFSLAGGSDREGRSAAAGGGGIGVVDHEARSLQAFLIVHLGTGQVLKAHRVDHQADALALDDGVVLGHFLIEGEAVLEAGAATAGDEHPQLQARIALFIDQALHLVRRALGKDQGGWSEGLDAHLAVLPAPGACLRTTGAALSAYPSKSVNYCAARRHAPAV